MNSYLHQLSVLLTGGLVLLATTRTIVQAAQEQTGSDWTQFRGPGGQGTTQTRGLPLTWSEEENVVWKTALPGAGASSPVLWKDCIYLTAYTGYGRGQPNGDGRLEDLQRHLLCLERVTGRLVWDHPVEVSLPEQDRIREDHGYATSTLAVDGDRIYAFFGASGVFAFDHNGTQLWHAKVGSGLSGWGSAASPVLCRDLVIINASVETESLVALNCETGREVWRAGQIKESWNTPILARAEAGRTELVVGVVGKVLSFDPVTGGALWRCDTDIGWYMCPSAVAAEGVVYVIGGRTGGALAVRLGGEGDVTQTHRLWTLKKGSNVSSPLLYEGHLYFAHENLGIVYCVKADTGELVYEERLSPSPGQIYPSPVLAEGRIYYVSREGRTAVVAARPQFELQAFNTLAREAGVFNASPVVAGSNLLLRSDRFLYCLGRR